MTITRHQIVARPDGSALSDGVPIISQAVVHGDVVYLCGVVTPVLSSDPKAVPDDVQAQTKQVLARIDELLAEAGTDKSKLLTAQVWLADMDHFAAHNQAWNEWVDPVNPPVRACVQARLFRPDLLVEIAVTAAR